MDEFQARTSSDRLGGASRDRTDDLMLAKHALSQLSYGPSASTAEGFRPRSQRRDAGRFLRIGGPGKI
jgi:hypothetical protein